MSDFFQNFTRSLRETKREAYADYDAASPNRFRRERRGLHGTADAHYANDRSYFEVVEYSRDMERNSFVDGLFTICVNQHIGPGFRYNPDSGDKALDAALADGKLEWWASKRFDTARTHTGADVEEMVFRAVIRDGDIFGSPQEDDGSVQTFENDRCRTPTNSRRNIVHGVELDDITRAPLRYYFTRGTVDPLSRVQRVADTTPVAAFDADGNPNIFHVKHPKRMTQTRGVGALVSAMIRAGILDDADFSTLIKVQMAAMAVGSWETDEHYTPASGDQAGARQTEIQPDGFAKVTEALNPGAIFHPPKGKKFKLHTANIPASEAMEFSRRCLQMLCLPLALPLVIATMDARETNFSGYRGAENTAKRLWRANQIWYASAWHAPVMDFRVRWLMAQKSALGKMLRSAYELRGPAIFRHGWNFPGWQSVQPMQDAQTKALRLSTLQTSPRRAAAEEGNEHREIVLETIDDNGFAIENAIERAQKIEKKTGVKVPYRELLNWDYAKGMQLIDSAEEENVSNLTGKEAAPNKTT